MIIAGMASVAVIGFFFIICPRRSAEGRSFRATFIGFTNGTLGPHAMFLLKEPEGVSSRVREVAYKQGTNWNTWIPPEHGSDFGLVFRRTNQTDRWWGPQPFEVTYHNLGSNLLTTISVVDTNACSRVVFELQEELHPLSESVWKFKVWLMEKDSPQKRFHLRWPPTRVRVYFLTNEINVSAKM